ATQITITLPAESLRQASTVALTVTADATPADAQPVACQVMTTHEFDKSSGILDMPGDLLSVSEAAEALGVSRQAVLKRIDHGGLL
ncbi:hypothetical protein ACP3WI_24755, partial [Salmonella enterica]